MNNNSEFSKNFSPSTTLNSLILMGGRGTRLEAHRKAINQETFPTLPSYWGEEGPKALTRLTLHKESLPLLNWHLNLHCKNPSSIKTFYLGLGFAGDMIEDYLKTTHQTPYQGHPLVILKEKRPAGTLAPLIKMYEQQLLTKQSLLVSNGDNFLETHLYNAYLRGLSYAQEQNLDPNKVVIMIASPVLHEISNNYGVLSLDNERNLAISFNEKRAVEFNEFEVIEGKKISWINSGFSFIVNPLHFSQTYINKEVIEISKKLEEGLLDYKSHEKQVKYETLYEQVAAQGHLIVIKQQGFWADSGNEELIKAIEEHYK